MGEAVRALEQDNLLLAIRHASLAKYWWDEYRTRRASKFLDSQNTILK